MSEKAVNDERSYLCRVFGRNYGNMASAQVELHGLTHSLSRNMVIDYSDLEKITHKVFFDIEIENGQGGRVVLGLFGDGKVPKVIRTLKKWIRYPRCLF